MSASACFVLSFVEGMDSVGLYTVPVMLDHTVTFSHPGLSYMAYIFQAVEPFIPVTHPIAKVSTLWF